MKAFLWLALSVASLAVAALWAHLGSGWACMAWGVAAGTQFMAGLYFLREV